MSDIVLSDLSNGVRTITLNRPAALNAMSTELIGALVEAFKIANADPETRAIIFTGAGRAFCAGADLKERRAGLSPEQARANTERLQQVTREMIFGDRLIIGAINGWAVGGGF